MSRSRLFTVGLLLAAVLAACSASASPSADEAGASAEATATQANPTAEETTAGAEPTLEEGAGDLASVLPDEVGGITLEYQHASGQDVFGSELDPEAAAFLERVGGDASSMSSAIGFGFDTESGAGISIVAFRIGGADESRLRDEFRAVIEEDGTQVTAETSVAGKNVLSFGPPESEPEGFMYVKGDTIFIIAGSPPELIEEAISALP